MAQKCHLAGIEPNAVPGRILGQIQPAAKAQLHDQVILGVAGAFVLLLNSPGNKSSGVIGPKAAHTAQAAVGRRTNAPVIFTVPIQQIVPPFVAGAGKVADLVLPVALLRQTLHGVQVKLRGGVGIRQARRRVAAKGGAGLDLEQVGRNMGAATRLQQGKGFIKLRDGIIGQRQHNIPADLPEACLPRPGKRLRGPSADRKRPP